MLLAQLNIALPVAPLDGPELAGFMAGLDPVNALAEAAPGFVWRLQTEDGDATAIRPFDDDRMLVNLTAWESVEALAAFVYSGEHRGYLRQRRDWFVTPRETHQVLWWSEEIPELAEALTRLDHLRAHGSTAHAFTFRQPFPAPGGQPVRTGDDWVCPV